MNRYGGLAVTIHSLDGNQSMSPLRGKADISQATREARWCEKITLE
jgi:hypothetical protein